MSIKYSNQEDEYIWKDLQSGSRSALEFIYRSHFDFLYDFGLRISPDHSQVSDAIQDLFVEIWNRRERLSHTTHIRPYLYVSLKRKLIRNIKKSRKESATELKEYHFETELSIDELIVASESLNENTAMLNRGFSKLSSRQKEILYLKYYSNLSYDEISEIMDLNYQSARNLVSRALKSLSSSLSIILIFIYFLSTYWR